jgi:uncharacterized protein YciI
MSRNKSQIKGKTTTNHYEYINETQNEQKLTLVGLITPMLSKDQNIICALLKKQKNVNWQLNPTIVNFYSF